MSFKGVFWQPGFNRNVTTVTLSLAGAFFILAAANAHLASSYETPTCTATTPLASPACSVKGDYIFRSFRYGAGGFATIFGGLGLIGFGSLLRRPGAAPRP